MNAGVEIDIFSLRIGSCNKKNAVRQKPAREQGRIICPSTVYALAQAQASVFKHLFRYMTEN